MNQDVRSAFILSFVAASLDALKREELALRKKRTAFFIRLETLEDGVNRALEKLPPTMLPGHVVSEKAAMFFDQAQALLDGILAGQ
jgi:hypothetical protein